MCVNDYCWIRSSHYMLGYDVLTKNSQLQWCMKTNVSFLPSLAEIQAEVAAYLCRGHMFSWRRERSNSGIMGWFFIFYFICGLVHFCWHSVGQSKSAGQAWHQWEVVYVPPKGRNPAMMNVIENISRQLGIVIQCTTILAIHTRRKFLNKLNFYQR